LSLAVAPFAANMLPYKAYEIENGKNYEVGQRPAIGAEVYGLKIAHLLIPQEGHRVKALAALKDTYNLSNDSILKVHKHGASLGFFGSIGFLMLILTLIFNKLASKTLLKLSQFNISLLLLSTIGSFGSIIAFTLNSQIRAYNRASIFIATLSLIAISLIISKYVKKKSNKNSIFFAVALIVFIVGIFDQIPKKYDLNANPKSKAVYLSDKSFIKKIESKFDISNQKISIAQYPYMVYPESGGVNNMKDYEHVLGFIHSDKIHWSFGAMKGREADIWWQGLSEKSIKEQIDVLQEAGFSGLMINRNGYKDNAHALEARLKILLNLNPILSENNKLSFFMLDPKSDKVLMPPVFHGFYGWEGESGKFRWAGDNANIVLYNYKDEIETKIISFELGTLRDREIIITLNNQTLEKFEMKRGNVSKHSYSLQLKQGKNTLIFETDEPAIVPGGVDNRKLLFSFGKFSLHKGVKQ